MFISKIHSKKEIAPNILEISLTAPTNFKFKPGQFIVVFVYNLYKRPYSIFEYKDDLIKIIVSVKHPGKGSEFFSNISINQDIKIAGPLGKFFCNYNNVNKVFISTGTGIAPFIPMIKNLVIKNYTKVTLFYGVKNIEYDLAVRYLSNEIKKIKYIQCLSFNKKNDLDFYSKNGRVTEILKEYDFLWKDTEFYICGRNEMIKKVKKFLLTKNVNEIFVENFG